MVSEGSQYKALFHLFQFGYSEGYCSTCHREKLSLHLQLQSTLCSEEEEEDEKMEEEEEEEEKGQ